MEDAANMTPLNKLLAFLDDANGDPELSKAVRCITQKIDPVTGEHIITIEYRAMPPSSSAAASKAGTGEALPPIPVVR